MLFSFSICKTTGEIFHISKIQPAVSALAWVELPHLEVSVLDQEGIVHLPQDLVYKALRALTDMNYDKWPLETAQRYLSYLIENGPYRNDHPHIPSLQFKPDDTTPYIFKDGKVQHGTARALKVAYSPDHLEALKSYKIPSEPKLETPTHIEVPAAGERKRKQATENAPTRPTRGVTKAIWDFLDEHPDADRAALKAQGEKEGWNSSTISVQYSAWKNAHQTH